MSEIIYVVIGIGIGFVIGVFISCILITAKTSFGTIRVDPEKNGIMLTIPDTMEVLRKKKKVIASIKLEEILEFTDSEKE